MIVDGKQVLAKLGIVRGAKKYGDYKDVTTRMAYEIADAVEDSIVSDLGKEHKGLNIELIDAMQVIAEHCMDKTWCGECPTRAEDGACLYSRYEPEEWAWAMLRIREAEVDQ